MAYAIIELGGKQYRVEKGDTLVVDRIDAKEGAKVSPRPLLYRSDETIFDGPALDKVRVEAVVAEHLKGDKVRVFKYRPKKRYRRRAGHRSALTRVEIKEIKGPAAPKAAAPKAAAHKATATEAAPKSRSGARRSRAPAKKEQAGKKESGKG
jgi:large subunit ribosomal protein L21